MDISDTKKWTNRLRFVTAASLFDGHDAAINIMRRVLQAEGTEVIHLGHDRSVAEIVNAAIEEDAHAIAVSSYQGGHVEFFSYMIELLKAAKREDILVFGGGGGTITDAESKLLQQRGVSRIYSVEDGRNLGLVGMIRDMMSRADVDKTKEYSLPESIHFSRKPELGRALSWVENNAEKEEVKKAIQSRIQKSKTPIIGITGTGGAGKSSLTDELVRRMVELFPKRNIAILSVDPSRRRSGGALLGDRIRMNIASNPHIFMRSISTRGAKTAVSGAIEDTLGLLQCASFDLIILETAGIGQGGTEVVELSDLAMYVMTPEFGAPTQLEKIDMLDFAELIAINKSDKPGAKDALQQVAKQVQRNRNAFHLSLDQMPVFLCSAARYGDAGVDRLFVELMKRLHKRTDQNWDPGDPQWRAPKASIIISGARVRYLSEVARTVRTYKKNAKKEQELAFRADGLRRTLHELNDDIPKPGISYPQDALIENTESEPVIFLLRQRYNAILDEMSKSTKENLRHFAALKTAYTNEENVYFVRNREIRVNNFTTSLSGNQIPKVAIPQTKEWAELVRWSLLENTPGRFPFTAGVFPYKRTGEAPTRMFAGEGTPERTNRRFHFVSQGQPAKRLSTAFDSVTLYGQDPEMRPDIYGKVGNSGVSVATLDDTKRLYSGFDLTSPTTSVSMTINGPAPMMLAMFLNTAIDQNVERRLKETGRWEDAQKKITSLINEQPTYRDPIPLGHDHTGLGTLGVSGDLLLSKEEYNEIKIKTLANVRGTVQADILKEDQAQNTCIFSTEFALKMMGDVQEYFVQNNIRNFYSVSISGYHIAEAGANPISQLAFTLANGFTYVEYYRSRGMKIDAFARNLSFFFSNGLDPEYAVIGRVARRIWAIAMRDLYSADERSQKLKYHIQTSGRSLHAQEMDFNDIRTTLQAYYALADQCNSLHTNAFDEAITTPTEASVRRALAIQLISNTEFGLLKNENPMQGAYIIETLTEIVEEAVLDEFERISSRGGVLGAMELMYQRTKIQEESLFYEHKKHSGELPIIGVNTFLGPENENEKEPELARSTSREKMQQVHGVQAFQQLNKAKTNNALEQVKQTALEGGNIFEVLMEAVKVCSLGELSQALFEVGGQYRRNM